MLALAGRPGREALRAAPRRRPALGRRACCGADRPVTARAQAGPAPPRSIRSRTPRWPNAVSTASSGCSGSTRSSRPPTATSARSIYYALGLVASFALGLTPIVFVIAGFIFFLTAATYAEATAMYPEAGGSSSFARHAFNEFWSFFAAWGQMLNYVITISISAFFVPHYLGVAVLGAAAARPGRRDRRDRRRGRCWRSINVVGVKEAARLNILLAVTDFATQLLLVVARDRARLLAADADRQRPPRASRRPGRTSSIAIPVAMIAYTGIETISNMAEEAKDEADDDPARDQPRRDRRLRDLRAAAGRRAVARCR